MSSTGARTGGLVNATVYGATKAGVISMTKSFARMYAKDNILVNAVAPGSVNTRMMTDLPAEALAFTLDGVPLGRLSEPCRDRGRRRIPGVGHVLLHDRRHRRRERRRGNAVGGRPHGGSMRIKRVTAHPIAYPEPNDYDNTPVADPGAGGGGDGRGGLG